MSQSEKNKPETNDSNANRRGMIFLMAGVALFGIAIAMFFFQKEQQQPQPMQDIGETVRAALTGEGAPTLGDPNAKVHVVEFLDPACETCALFFPLVKNWMKEVPGQIRLTVRHVAFHEGADYAVKVLEASRKQDKYWETLEAMLRAQSQWTEHHKVLPERIGPAIASVGLDMDKLQADMNSMAVLRRFEQDKRDAITLKIRQTPTYFVNGRPLPSFGAQQLADLVREELEK
jgi:protein-disulfide isomerase